MPGKRPAYVIAEVEITDAEVFREYVSKAVPKGPSKHWGDHAALAKVGFALEIRSNRCPNPAPSVPL
jgi:hypothetical protein